MNLSQKSYSWAKMKIALSTPGGSNWTVNRFSYFLPYFGGMPKVILFTNGKIFIVDYVYSKR